MDPHHALGQRRREKTEQTDLRNTSPLILTLFKLNIQWQLLKC